MDPHTKLKLEKEILPFLDLQARKDLKYVANRSLLELTGSKEGCDFLAEGDKFIKALMSLTTDKESDICKDAMFALVNLTSDEKVAWRIMGVDDQFIFNLLHKTLQPEFEYADQAASIISNVTRVLSCAKKLSELIIKDNSKVSVENIVNVLCKINFNKNASLHCLGLILSNLTQVPSIRKIMMDKDRCIVQKLLPFTEYAESLKKRGGIVGTLKNCCFEYDFHSWLLSDEVDILSRLLLPLAGGEEFDDDEMDKLPVDLQYLPPDKKREEDPDLRTMLIEAITQLCATKQGRLLIKDKNAFVILRELHKWEKDPAAKLACQKLCELLISDEPEVGMEELHTVEVTEELQTKFDKLDVELMNDMEESLNPDSEQADDEAITIS